LLIFRAVLTNLYCSTFTSRFTYRIKRKSRREWNSKKFPSIQHFFFSDLIVYDVRMTLQKQKNVITATRRQQTSLSNLRQLSYERERQSVNFYHSALLFYLNIKGQSYKRYSVLKKTNMVLNCLTLHYFDLTTVLSWSY